MHQHWRWRLSRLRTLIDIRPWCAYRMHATHGFQPVSCSVLLDAPPPLLTHFDFESRLIIHSTSINPRACSRLYCSILFPNSSSLPFTVRTSTSLHAVIQAPSYPFLSPTRSSMTWGVVRRCTRSATSPARLAMAGNGWLQRASAACPETCQVRNH